MTNDNINVKKKDLFYGLVFTVILLSLVGGSYHYNYQQEEAFIDYTIATNYIDTALYSNKIAEINYGSYLSYTYSDEGYYYDDAIDYLDSTLEDLNNNVEVLTIAKDKLNSINKIYISDFYEKEIELRLEQIDLMIKGDNLFIEIIELNNDELYEINYGSEFKASSLNLKSIDKSDEYDDILEDYLKVNDKIDIYWEEDFYPN